MRLFGKDLSPLSLDGVVKADLKVLVFYIGVFALIFRKAIFQGHYYLPVNTSYHELAYNLPLIELVARSWSNWSLPLWNPFINFGVPLVDSGSMAFSPFYVFYFLFPALSMANAVKLLHLLCLAFFTYKFLFEITSNRYAALVAGLVASLNGFTLVSYLHSTSYVYAVSMLPLLLLVIERYLKNPDETRYLFLLPVFMGFIFLMVILPSALFVLSAAYLYFILRFFDLWKDIRNRISPFKVLFYVNAAFFAGCVIGGVQIAQVYELLVSGERGSKAVDYYARAGISLLDFGSIAFNMIFPHFFGVIDRSLNFNNMFLGTGDAEYGIRAVSLYFYSYFGIIILFLIVAAFIKIKQNMVFVFYSFSIPLFLLLIESGFVKNALHHLTGGFIFNMHINFSIEIFFMLGIPVLAGLGMNSLLSLDIMLLKKPLAIFSILMSLLMAAYLIVNVYLLISNEALNHAYHRSIDILISSGTFPAYHSPSYYHEKFDFFFHEFVNNLPLTNFRTALPLLLMTGFILSSYLYITTKLSKTKYTKFIVIAITLDLVVFASVYVITLPSKDFLPSFDFINHLKQDQSQYRVAALYSDDYVLSGDHAFKPALSKQHFNFNDDQNENPLLIVEPERHIEDYQWYANILAHYGIQSITGSSMVTPSRYRNFLRAMENGKLYEVESMVYTLFNYNSRLLDLANVKYLLSTKELVPGTRFKKVSTDGRLMVFENRDVLPRAFMTGKYLVENKPDALLTALDSSAIDLRKTALLEKEPIQTEMTIRGPGQAEAHILNYANNAVTIKTNSDRPGILVLLDQYFPGWKVFVDGEEKEILRTDYLFRGVYVPSGVHTVEYRYRPTTLFVSLAISMSVLILCLFFYIRQRSLDKTRRAMN